ncbi:MAG: biotin--[acetyl-CoA-carboxylase] ligase [Legionella sp.]|nr:MAG: biotin--[acetyl-CoA-carboxylase] ligase [Legionella sp.]
MKQLSTTQQQLIQLLNDQKCHSGNELGKILNISRTAIWKQITQLIELGIPIQPIAQQGYQLTQPFKLLDEERIGDGLKCANFPQPFALHIFSSIDSTNKFLKELSPSHLIEICCAEKQTQGRGRFGRQWYSPFGENIYCSSRWDLHCDLNKLSGLSLVVSLAIVNVLKTLVPSEELRVKWPNDILWKDQKLCGILIEILAESNSNAQVIIGIGLNINSDTQKHPLPDREWCSLYEITKDHFDRNLIVIAILKELSVYMQRFLEHGLNDFISEWNDYDYLAGKNITVLHQSTHQLNGIARGINAEGLLIVEEDTGQTHYLSSGDTTLRQEG